MMLGNGKKANRAECYKCSIKLRYPITLPKLKSSPEWISKSKSKPSKNTGALQMSDLFDTGIRPAIDAYLKARSEEKRNYGEYWSASSAGYCMRLNIMRRLGVPRVPELEDNATQTRIFEAGHIFHEFLQRITKDAGLSIASEVELQDENLMIRGHFDDLILKDGKLLLYDYKTAHSASFKFKKQQKK